MTLTACMIVKNEEDNLPRCLESIKDIVNEIVIVDTGSQDSTVEIARKYGAKVYFFEWNDDFSAARNYSLDKAASDWILLMDADDEFFNEDKEALKELLKNDEIEAAYFETLNFAGDTPGMDVVINLNLRLVRNHKGYKFEGAIHEQMAGSIERVNKNARISIEKIRIRHYGYLNKTVAKQNKRTRNMRIIEKSLKQNQNDPFMLFNMGNEYYALADFKKALEFYKKAYELINICSGYSPKLIGRLVSTHEELGMLEEELGIIEKGLEYYPGFTDLEYHRGGVYHRQKKYTLSIKSFKKCLEMGEPNSSIGFIIGVGSYRAHFALAEIHYELEDYDEAYNHYIETLKLKSEYVAAFYRIAQIHFKKKEELSEIKSKLESFFIANMNEPVLITLHDIFFKEGYYEIAFEYLLRSEILVGEQSRIIFLKGRCLFFMKRFQEAYQLFNRLRKDKIEDFFEGSTYGMILCDILSYRYKNAKRVLEGTIDFQDTKTRVIYNAVLDILNGSNPQVIAESEDASQEYIRIMFEFLDTLLREKEFDLFEKSLNLLNIVESKELLLRLAKLYYNYGFYNLAYQEFVRSIKLFEKIDAEGLKMMQKALMYK